MCVYLAYNSTHLAGEYKQWYLLHLKSIHPVWKNYRKYSTRELWISNRLMWSTIWFEIPLPLSNILIQSEGQWRSHWGGKGGRVPPLTEKNLPKIGKKRVKIRKKEEKSGRKGKNQEGSFTLPLLTDRAGYQAATIRLPDCPGQSLFG